MSEAVWFYEDGTRHVCDSFGCTKVAVGFWEFWSNKQGVIWHMCADCTASLTGLIGDHFNPVYHEPWEDEGFDRRLA